MSLRNPIARARGPGSAHDGTGHFWMQRLTAIALIPLSIWFVAAMVGLTDSSHAHVVAWIAVPWNATLLLSLIIALFWHSSLGIQVVIDDYIHLTWAKVTATVLQRFAHILLAVASIVAVVRIVAGAS